MGLDARPGASNLLKMSALNKTYPVTWSGELLLACRKCQKKLKGDLGRKDLAHLKKTVKQHNREHPERKLHVVGVSCMDLCPKDGVTVCVPQRSPVRLQILRSAQELRTL